MTDLPPAPGMAEVARFTGLSHYEIKRLLNTGKFPAPIDSDSARRRWRRADILRFMGMEDTAVPDLADAERLSIAAQLKGAIALLSDTLKRVEAA